MTLSRLALLVMACLLPLTRSHGMTAVTPEEATARGLAEWTRMCAESKDGQIPGSWGEYRSLLKLSLDDVFATTEPTTRYAILETPVKLTPPLAGDVLIINRSPILDTVPSSNPLGPGLDLKGPGRYVIYHSPDGGFASAWVTEDYVKSVFAAAKVALPEPDHGPERLWVIQAQASKVRFWEITGGMAVLLAILAFAFKRAAARIPLPQPG